MCSARVIMSASESVRVSRGVWRAFFLFLLLFIACQSPTPTLPLVPPTASPTPTSGLETPLSDLRVGWAYEAYPEAPLEKMRSDMARMRANGATAIWLGHNNPGTVDATKVEPGLSFAVYAALQYDNGPLNRDAHAMADAVKRALDAAREAGLQVILPIGYQIQMGEAWNLSHPNELRVSFDGAPLNFYNSGFTASPYSPQYRADITHYYEWIQNEWVEPYADVLSILSLADEPMGGDYSPAAKQEFARRYGKEMDALDAAERWHVGEFQAGVIADYAAWSANEWQRINPRILTTMSFHGGETARREWGLPDVERLFSQTPDNFIVSFDAYLHDDIAAKPATPEEAAQLKLFLTTIGYYSRVYNKPVALWGGVNAWGLAQESLSPLGISDAVTNLLLLYDLPARIGGNVWGIFAWNYNVKQQGLENYERPTTYDVRAMEIAVNRTFPLLRTRQPHVSNPDIAIWLSPRELWDALAETRAADVPPPWFDATPYARAFADYNAVFVTSGRSLEALRDVHYLIVPRASDNLSELDLEFLRVRLAQGQVVLATSSVARAVGAETEPWHAGLSDLPTIGVVLYSLDSR